MWRPGWRRLQLDDCPSDPFPDSLPVDIGAFEHQISASGGFQFGIGTMPVRQQVGGSPDVKFRDHGVSMTNYGVPGRGSAGHAALGAARVAIQVTSGLSRYAVVRPESEARVAPAAPAGTHQVRSPTMASMVTP
jgi:hypothetical protein